MMDRPTMKFDMNEALAAAVEIKQSVDADLQRTLQEAATGAIAQGYQQGYMKALADYGLQPRPSGVSETVQEVEQRFTLVTDNDSHRYLIPADKLEDWTMWCNIPEDDVASWDIPLYARRIDGGRVTFADPVVE